jgi:glucan phosphorylase
MMNGALLIGSNDGTNIEIAKRVSCFLFNESK